MKKFLMMLLAVAAVCSCVSKSGVIQVDVPKRPAGQEHVLGLAVAPIDTVRVGFVGLGSRGPYAVRRFTKIPGTKIVALCDIRPERVEYSQEILRKAGLPDAAAYSGSPESYKELCEREDIDLVYVCTDWVNHAPIALYAMEHGKHTAIEVPAATTLDEIWQLINTSERTRKHCFQLENCVYDFFELTTLNMAQQGIFGEILHVEGSYIHDLSDFWDGYWNNWRLDFNKDNRGDVYPTHGFGPACQLLDIHRGDRLKTLVAMDTKAVNGPKNYEKYTGEKCESFRNADHTLTMLTTENGKTMLIQHNVMTPRPYSRMYQLTGTDGFANKYPVQQYSLRPRENVPKNVDLENLNAHKAVPEDVKKQLMEEYKHRIHREIEDEARKAGGHGGMDYVMEYRLVYCLRNGLPLDMDVYDLAEWCSITELSRISLDNGNMPVAVPDFTRGHWNDVKGFRHAFAD